MVQSVLMVNQELHSLYNDAGIYYYNIAKCVLERNPEKDYQNYGGVLA